MRFYLFRIKLQMSKQSDLFDKSVSRPGFLAKMLNAKPSEEIRKGYVWHIGNVQKVRNKALFFAAGRTTSSTVEAFDESKKDFYEAPFDESPFTYVMVDLKYSVAGIAHKSRLAPTVKGVARNIERLLNASELARRHNVRIIIDEINDPKHFLHYVSSAYAVRAFTAEF